ncbi:FHA domain-containing protein [Marinagarivorans cellulosilyticus]|uniref:FHA domain-containing protein n=1 Tax=Marinagarivorans cellulosilyticus TaxID=2721545 RepID=A0AAN1WK93_9GAMM|nr:FHA domain-containing protein [Marinagarivorans cellulosilyticus]BCD99119.1 hypothetical protein MARGE09_P3320 [Marinagarivorans cellulosilyticus]
MALIVERINRSNHVLTLNRFCEPVVSVGRGFDQALIVDDLFVDAQHVQLSVDELTHAIQCVDLGSKNGVWVEPVVGKKYRLHGKAQLTSGDIIVIGRTRLRLCHSAHHVPEAQALTLRHRFIHAVSIWPVVVVMAVIVAIVSIVESYLALPVATALKRYSLESLYVVAAVFAYGVAWASVGRALRGDGRFVTQALVAGAGVVVLSALSFTVPWFAYHLPSEAVWGVVNTMLTASVFFIAVLASVAMATRLMWLGRVAAALLVPSAMVLNLVITYIDRPESVARVPYQRVLVAPASNYRSAIGSSAFVLEAQALYGLSDGPASKE